VPEVIWDDWTPGVLSRAQVLRLCDEGHIAGVKDPVIDRSALELTLGSEALHMTRGAVKPSGARYQALIRRHSSPLAPDADGTFTLKPKETYLFKVRERLEELEESGIYGQATAKSSVGRVDVLARLVVDGMDGYEFFSPKKLASGDMYLEVTPLTFSVKVKEGISLSQLRFFYGAPQACEISGPEAYRTFLKGSSSHDGTLSVDLSPATIHGHKVIAFSAKEGAESQNPVHLWEGSEPNPCDYWKFVRPDEHGCLSLRKDQFYILRSREQIALPKGIAVYCRAIDETFGEMRIHYAGFVHPLFGRSRVDGVVGTPLIFEVRGHDVHVNLQQGERMARLTFYRMSEDAEPVKPEDVKVDPYGSQTLKLSKFFLDWPENISVADDGSVSPLGGQR
jgi:dCTP deaminase